MKKGLLPSLLPKEGEREGEKGEGGKDKERCIVCHSYFLFSDKTVDILYLTDADRCLLVIKAWEGLKVSQPHPLIIICNVF